MKIRNFLYRKEQFWRLKLFVQRSLSFELFTRVYGVRRFAREQKTNFYGLRSFLMAFAFYLLYGGFIVFLLRNVSTRVRHLHSEFKLP